jgi:hypothetical protein
MILNGLVETGTGYLLSYGYTDYTTYVGYDPLVAYQVANCPNDSIVLNDARNPTSPEITYWDGVNWGWIARP